MQTSRNIHRNEGGLTKV